MSTFIESEIIQDFSSFDPQGRTVGEVAAHIEGVLQPTEIEPEWVSVANTTDDANETLFGLRSTAPWPVTAGPLDRLSISVTRVNSTNWLIQVDRMLLVDADQASSFWQSIPVVRIKTLSRMQAWAVAATVARLLHID